MSITELGDEHHQRVEVCQFREPSCPELWKHALNSVQGRECPARRLRGIPPAEVIRLHHPIERGFFVDHVATVNGHHTLSPGFSVTSRGGDPDSAADHF
jgi:hypothetical protein